MTPPTSVGAFPIQFKSIPTVIVNYLNDKAYKGRGGFVWIRNPFKEVPDRVSYVV